MNLVYTVDAVDDLARLREFIEIHNPVAAQRISTKLVEGITILKDYPKIGHPVLNAPDSEVIRDLIVGGYIARYLLHKDTTVILRIWHHRENLENEL